jgi:hypothetical protein
MEKVGFVYERDIVHADLPHVLYRLTASQWRRMATIAPSPSQPISVLQTFASNRESGDARAQRPCS